MDPQLQKVSVQPQRDRPVSYSASCLCPVVVLQLCVSDGVEDLMESLVVESDKSLTSQEPVSHHSVGPAAEHLQGEN